MNKKPTKSFKADMNLPKLFAQFGSDDKCREQLTSLRWPKGVTCPRCHSKSISTIAERTQYDCNACRYQFSVTSGTISGLVSGVGGLTDVVTRCLRRAGGERTRPPELPRIPDHRR